MGAEDQVLQRLLHFYNLNRSKNFAEEKQVKGTLTVWAVHQIPLTLIFLKLLTPCLPSNP